MAAPDDDLPLTTVSKLTLTLILTLTLTHILTLTLTRNLPLTLPLTLTLTLTLARWARRPSTVSWAPRQAHAGRYREDMGEI